MNDDLSSRFNRKPRSQQTVHVVLPAYNEEPSIGRLLARLDEAMCEAGLSYSVIVVDDGSDDVTVKVANEFRHYMPIVIKEHKVNQGLGAAIRDGLIMAVASAADRDVIVTMVADETHTPGLILRMVRMIREGYDVVIASRYHPEAQTYGVPLTRGFMSYAASLLFRCMFPTRGVRDFTCGYRAYRADVLRMAIGKYGHQFVDQDGFQCVVDILLKLRGLGLIFGEVPMVLRYDLKRGKSKMKVIKTARSTLMLLLRRRFFGVDRRFE